MSDDREPLLERLVDHALEIIFLLPILAIFLRLAWEILTQGAHP